MTDPLEQVIKAQRIDFIVNIMIHSKVEGEQRFLLDEWLGELTKELVDDLKGFGRLPQSPHQLEA